MTSPAYRNLRGYCLDPGFSTRLDTAAINEVVYQIPFERLEPGPVGEYVEVVDFDPASNCWYEPVDLGDEHIASQLGHLPSEGNPQFHQQFVYAVAMKTIGHFERALGRKIIWSPRARRLKGERWTRRRMRAIAWKQWNRWRTRYRKLRNFEYAKRWEGEYVGRLRIYPHALRDANAYYDPDKKALLFGYFAAADQSQGANYPGGLVFTCLSPDIVAHEMTHAILDSIHHYYFEATNPDVAAFHEGFSDIIALLQRFTFGQLVEHQLYTSGGRMDRYNVLGELATQFGEALEGNQGALRSMIGKWNDKGQWVPLKPSPSDYARNFEAHDRGAVLVATIFDAFQRIYKHRTSDLLRIATSGTGVLPKGSISRDLVHRLAGEASEIAHHLLHICIRALDYCPPHDITYGDYLCALITADLDIAPEDENGYRVALIEAFRARGIFPDRVNTLSIDSLRWNKPDFTAKQSKILIRLAEQMEPFVRDLLDKVERHEHYKSSQRAQRALSEFLDFPPIFTNRGRKKRRPGAIGPLEWERFLNKLGLTSHPVSQLFGRDSSKVRFMRDGKPDDKYVPSIEVHTVRPAFRVGREGRQILQVLVTLTQCVTADIGIDGQCKLMEFRGGCSLIFSLGDLKTVDFVVQKNIKSYRRFCRQAEYIRGEIPAAAPAMSLYANDDPPWRLNFSLLHQHSYGLNSIRAFH
jgi:hypothetical protein